MPLTIKAFTLNCGNGTPGITAYGAIEDAYNMDNTDVILLHCQETDHEATVRDLKAKFRDAAAIQELHHMPTHTKKDVILTNRTGIVTIAIKRPGIAIEAKGENVRGGIVPLVTSRYNKGGVFTDIEIKKGDEKYRIHSTNAHLDAFSESTRAEDWANLHRAQRIKSHTNINDLAKDIPDMVVSGFDGNTRDKIIGGTPWKYQNPIPGMRSLLMGPLGNQRVAKPSTYHATNPESVSEELDKKRVGELKGGMLDLCCFNSMERIKERERNPNTPPVDTTSATFIPMVEHEKRDHAGIGSPAIIVETSNKPTPFEKVKNYLACALAEANPNLAEEISQMTGTEEDQEKLINCHNTYVAADGLLQKRIELHTKQLQFIDNLKDMGLSERTIEDYKTYLFAPTPWFKPTISLDFENEMAVHKEQLELDQLAFDRLTKASKQELTIGIPIIIQNANTALLKTSNQNEQDKIIAATQTLLNVLQIVREYEVDLQSERANLIYSEKEAINDIEYKIGVVQEIKNILLQRDNSSNNINPIKIAKDLNTKIGDKINKDEKFIQHRDKDFFSRIFREIKSFFTGTKETETKGVELFREAKSKLEALKLEEPSTDLDPEQQPPTM